MDYMELHGLELCIRMAMVAYIDEDRLMVRADRIGSDRIGSDRIGSDRIGSDRMRTFWRGFWKKLGIFGRG